MSCIVDSCSSTIRRSMRNQSRHQHSSSARARNVPRGPRKRRDKKRRNSRTNTTRRGGSSTMIRSARSMARPAHLNCTPSTIQSGRSTACSRRAWRDSGSRLSSPAGFRIQCISSSGQTATARCVPRRRASVLLPLPVGPVTKIRVTSSARAQVLRVRGNARPDRADTGWCRRAAR